MCASRSLLASSMKGRLSSSESAFHWVPSLLEISELCIFGFSSAIFFLIFLDQTMKAFMGLLTLSSSSTSPEELVPGGPRAVAVRHCALYLSVQPVVVEEAPLQQRPLEHSEEDSRACLAKT